MWYSKFWMLPLVFFLSCSCLVASRGREEEGSLVKTSVFISPSFFLEPGSVSNKYYFDIPFPKGHIALKSFVGEVIDENGSPVPLHETYLHHWLIGRYYGQKGAIDDPYSSKFIMLRNSGACKHTLQQYFGLGSETRKTETWVPDPYGIKVGNPTEIPDGYSEKWFLNIHAIDTRGVEDRLGCTECKCSLYNVTEDEHGRPLANGYVGGLYCCYDQTQCRLRRGYAGIGVRKLYLQYTVKWVEWNPGILPVKIYILDVTDTAEHLSGSISANAISSCKVEYSVRQCESADEGNGDCVDIKKAKVVLPHGGDIIYGVAHQHTGGIGSALYGEDGQMLCMSNPLYGKGKEAGDEAGYIVGMTTCYPQPGFVKIKDGELLTVVSNYSSARMHTGVMGLFYILVAESRPPPKSILSQRLEASWIPKLVENLWVLLFAGGIMGGIMVVVAAAVYCRRCEADGYQMVLN